MKKEVKEEEVEKEEEEVRRWRWRRRRRWRRRLGRRRSKRWDQEPEKLETSLRKRWDQESEKLETSLVPNTLWNTDGQDFKSENYNQFFLWSYYSINVVRTQIICIA